MDFSKPHTVDMTKVAYEVNLNYISALGLTNAFMPHFLAQKGNEPAFM